MSRMSESEKERKFLIWNKEVKNVLFFFPASPLKKGEKSDIWTWPIYKSQLPVTCGLQDGILCRDKLAKGQTGKGKLNDWSIRNTIIVLSTKETKHWEKSALGPGLEIFN